MQRELADDSQSWFSDERTGNARLPETPSTRGGEFLIRMAVRFEIRLSLEETMNKTLIGLCLFAGSLVVSKLGLAQDATDSTRRPNVLFIAVDDLRPELACYGSEAVTPNIDQLAASGVLFNRAYCNQAVCGASRVSIMTGLYPEFTGERTYHVTDWRTRWNDVVTLNQHFKQSGYTTVGLGKVYHGSSGPGVDPDNWTQWIKVRGKEYSTAKPKDFRQRNGKSRGPSTEAADVPDDAHADGNRAEAGADQIRKLAKKGEPFFLAVGFTKPHLPFVAPKRYWDLYDRDSFAMPENLGIPPGYPTYASNARAGELRAYSDIPTDADVSEFSDSLNKRLLHGYHACVSYTDRNIGVLLSALKDSGADANTIVVLWADHGWKLGDHTSWCKHTNFECDARVPLIIRQPGGAPAQTEALVELIDLYPTLCELCTLDPPEHLQGRSLAAVLNEPTVQHRSTAYSSYPHGNKKRALVGHSIRTPQYRYTEWWDKKTDAVVDSALTDIVADPGETTSVEDDRLKSELSAQLRIRVLAARKQ